MQSLNAQRCSCLFIEHHQIGVLLFWQLCRCYLCSRHTFFFFWASFSFHPQNVYLYIQSLMDICCAEKNMLVCVLSNSKCLCKCQMSELRRLYQKYRPKNTWCVFTNFICVCSCINHRVTLTQTVQKLTVFICQPNFPQRSLKIFKAIICQTVIYDLLQSCNILLNHSTTVSLSAL